MLCCHVWLPEATQKKDGKTACGSTCRYVWGWKPQFYIHHFLIADLVEWNEHPAAPTNSYTVKCAPFLFRWGPGGVTPVKRRKISQFSMKEVAQIAWAFANLRFHDLHLYQKTLDGKFDWIFFWFSHGFSHDIPWSTVYGWIMLDLPTFCRCQWIA